MSNDDQVRRGDRRADLPGHYGQLLTDQAASGLSMRQFAAAVGVSARTLYAWKRRLELDDAGTTAPSKLVAVDVIGHDMGRLGSESYTIAFPSGASLRVPRDFDAERVSELVMVLRTC